MIIVSTDEKKYVKDEFNKYIHKNINFEHIEIGDIVAHNFIIERKQINDLYTSVLDGRLFKQLEAMKDFIEKNPSVRGMLLIEGFKLKKNLKKFERVFKLEEIMVGALLTYNIIPVRTNSISETVQFIKELNQYSEKNKNIIRYVRGYKRKKSIGDKKKFVLMGFPTIGSKRADTILKKYNTLMDYFNDVAKGKDNKIKEVLTK